MVASIMSVLIIEQNQGFNECIFKEYLMDVSLTFQIPQNDS